MSENENPVEAILKRRIRDAGGGGLVDYNGTCGCDIDDLAPCGAACLDCEIAVVLTCDVCNGLTYVPIAEPIQPPLPCYECGAPLALPQPPTNPNPGHPEGPHGARTRSQHGPSRV